MHKFRIALAFFLLSGSLTAQLPNGSIAPSLIAKDINGRKWNLYDILESGRSVVMDVFATWCGPCWNYHISGALDLYYAQHGLPGDNKSMVFLIEGDPSSPIACLYGSTGCSPWTMGNWLDGTLCPVMNIDDINVLYQCNYFPTVYLICPDKTVTEVGQPNAFDLWQRAKKCVGNVPAKLAKVQDLKFTNLPVQACGTHEVHPVARVVNMGSTPIQDFEIALRWNNDVLQTKSITGNLKVFDEDTVYFNPFILSGPGTLTAEITSLDGVANGLPIGTKSVDIAPSPQAFVSQKIILFMHNDPAKARENWWGLYDDNGNLLYHGGNELVGPNGADSFLEDTPNDPSAYANNEVVLDTLAVPDCFSFRIIDSHNDGQASPGFIELFDPGTPSIFYMKSGNWGAEDWQAFSRKTTAVSTLIDAEMFKLTPNPVSENLNIRYDLNRSIPLNAWVTDATGQVVWSQSHINGNPGENNLQLSVARFYSGVYAVSFQLPDGIVTKKFVVIR